MDPSTNHPPEDLAEWILGCRFRTTRMGRSYRVEQVDDFLDHVAQYSSDRLTARRLMGEVAGKKFDTVRFGTGYSIEDVDTFMQLLQDALRRV
ncbi:DivIVA domain-containing protein [Kocuria sp.]|uniref:DivIVA domain-containing protein n=1 Tax=Kocuria sp. TaxID=1871328 RepID=UPI0026E11270|nr:DivIVA domain-containing protein [Kocuria sp.]MDO5617584.1 DivIVA domain-containing protein [Kocuria sp.]